MFQIQHLLGEFWNKLVARLVFAFGWFPARKAIFGPAGPLSQRQEPYRSPPEGCALQVNDGKDATAVSSVEQHQLPIGDRTPPREDNEALDIPSIANPATTTDPPSPGNDTAGTTAVPSALRTPEVLDPGPTTVTATQAVAVSTAPPEIATITEQRGKALNEVSIARAPESSSTRTVRAPLTEPITGAVPPPLTDQYGLWNRAIIQHCLLEAPSDHPIYLTITPRVLSACLQAVGITKSPTDDVQASFVSGVAAEYQRSVLGDARRLAVLRRFGSDGYPQCVAFLALSVLAAYTMRSDEDAAATAYYFRLAELLQCELLNGRPLGFDPQEFENLWHFLQSWLQREHTRTLTMPGPDAGARRFIAFPLTHAPFRQVDVERLPAFFSCAGYEPNAQLAEDQLDADLRHWCDGRIMFTKSGTAALKDERRQAIIIQILDELECWDGSQTNSHGRRSASVDLLLEFHQRQPHLLFLPRRPREFPASFDDGIHNIEAGVEGWYSPFDVTGEDGPSLRDGFEWENSSQDERVYLTRPGASAIAFGPSQFDGFISRRGLLLGVRGAALCHEDHLTDASEYLAAITGLKCAPAKPKSGPDGWVLFTSVTPVTSAPCPDVLQALALDSGLQIIPEGGLRIGGRWAWLTGAAPSLFVTGARNNAKATIDGEEVSIDGEGRISTDGKLAQAGVHFVEVGATRRRVEILDPEFHPQGEVSPLPGTDELSVVGLPPPPRGSWKIIGSSPEELTAALSTGATLVRCPFNAVWAVSVGSGRGALVMSLSASPPKPSGSTGATASEERRLASEWASLVYQASIRRPQIVTVSGKPANANITGIWKSYADKARRLKKSMRVGSR
jgi:hypothetical protein